ncbi:unnamed protein product [Trifolium pratense]|uniref:Uncharacterized protein n=1 Tax=Trifolium pratense TaxID=57577 RepID=A0ACB0JEH1_TRIPR|nr:unnamed protein product [Trifolium pratense]
MGRAKDWLQCIPSGTINTWTELEDKFLERYFTNDMFLARRADITDFEQGESENKNEDEVRQLVENICMNEYRSKSDRKRGVIAVDTNTALLAQIEILNKKLAAKSLAEANASQVQEVKCDFCHGPHANGMCSPEAGEVNYAGGYQKNNPYSNTYNPGWKDHPDLQWGNQGNFSQGNSQNPPSRKSSPLEETINKFMQMTQSNFEAMRASQETSNRNHEASIRNLETQIGQMSKQVAAQSNGGFAGNTLDNPRNESLEKKSETEGEVENEWLIVNDGEVEKEGGVEKNERLEEEKNENENKGNTEGEVEKIEKLIDADSMLRKTKAQLLKEHGKEQVIPSYVKLPYPHLKKKKEKEEGQFKRFVEVFKNLQINVPFSEALEQMPIYAKFMKDLLSGKRKLRDDENVALSEECSAILQRKFPPKLKDPGSFTIPCSIGKVKVERALCDLGASINLMPLSMVRKLDCGEPKPTKMTLTLADRSITYPYGVLEDVLVTVNDLFFPADFVILDMNEDSEVPLLLGRPFLATGRALIDVELGELMLRFQNEQVTFNVFESMRHQNENPQCYRVGVVEELEEEIAQDEPPIRSIEQVNVLVEENKKKGGSMKQMKAPMETPKTPLKKKRKKWRNKWERFRKLTLENMVFVSKKDDICPKKEKVEITIKYPP